MALSLPSHHDDVVYSGDVVGGLRAKYGRPAQLLFEDHCKPCYLSDLKIAEASGLVVPGTWSESGGCPGAGQQPVLID